ncbi:hypothetical protein GIB67_038462 [Kingdonia uniflora]|uniref:Uncharacterized protein n=1 Tax=Kingdonia uniflora TaxID=39325 RepID=A0A7J7NP51_9MAGN|nr:hypothetical protein GIB67_038462 [Kingdonia uniflora]
MYWSSGGEIKLIVSESSIKQMVDEFVMCGVVGHIFVRCPTTIGTSINEGVGYICTLMLHPPPRELDELPLSPSRQEHVEEVEEEYVEEPNDDDPHVNPVKEYLSRVPSEYSTVEEDIDGGELGEEGLRAADDLYSDDTENMVEPMENNIILEAVLPNGNQGFGMRHIYSNFKKQHKAKALENIVWRIARAYTVVEHGRCMEKLKELFDGAWAWTKAMPFNLWCRAYFDNTTKCEHLMDNFSESFNSWMTGLRDLPVYQFVEKIHLKIVTLMFYRRKKAKEWSVDDVVPRAKKLHENHKLEYQKYIYRGVIDLELGIASNIWSVKTIHSKISSYIDTYKDHITPFSHMPTWDNSISRVLPPPLRRPLGRPKVTRVRAGDEERPGRKRNGYKCGKYRVFGDNARSCKGPPSSNV